MSKEWKKLIPNGNAPIERTGHSAVILKDSMYIFGGTDETNKLNDLWEYKITENQWKKIEGKGDIPPVRKTNIEILGKKWTLCRGN